MDSRALDVFSMNGLLVGLDVAAAADAVRRALAQAPDGVVLGLGLASMGESGVPLDSQGAPRTPIIAGHEGTRA
jgi:hypothetical protein